MRFAPSFAPSFARLLALLGIVAGIQCVVPVARVQAQYVPPANHRVDLNFNYDWKFIKQDVPGAQAVGFDDSAWTAVSLPHI